MITIKALMELEGYSSTVEPIRLWPLVCLELLCLNFNQRHMACRVEVNMSISSDTTQEQTKL